MKNLFDTGKRDSDSKGIEKNFALYPLIGKSRSRFRRTGHSKLLQLVVIIPFIYAWHGIVISAPAFTRYDADGNTLVSALEIAAGTGIPRFHDQPNYPAQYITAVLLWADMKLAKEENPTAYRNRVKENFDLYMVFPGVVGLFYTVVALVALCSLAMLAFGPSACFLAVPVLLVGFPHLLPTFLITHPNAVCDYTGLLGVVIGCHGAVRGSKKRFVTGCALIAAAGSLKLNFFPLLAAPFLFLAIEGMQKRKMPWRGVISFYVTALAVVAGISAVLLAPFWLWPNICVTQFLAHLKGVSDFKLANHLATVKTQILSNHYLLFGAFLAMIFLRRTITFRSLIAASFILLAMPLLSPVNSYRYFRHAFTAFAVCTLMLPARLIERRIRSISLKTSSKNSLFSDLKVIRLLIALICLTVLSAFAAKKNADMRQLARTGQEMERIAFEICPVDGGCIWAVSSLYAPPILAWNQVMHEIYPDIMPRKFSPLRMAYTNSERIADMLSKNSFIIFIDQDFLDYQEQYLPNSRRRLDSILKDAVIILEFKLPNENIGWLISSKEISESVIRRITGMSNKPFTER